jgi:anti-anti-sigma factor
MAGSGLIVELLAGEVQGVQRVRLTGELDISDASALAGRLLRIEAPTVEVDLSGLRLMDAGGLRGLVSAKADMERSGHSLVLVGATGMVRLVFGTLGLASWLAD